jgi:para-aminobenzoate synthetase/4-amino-4-deoxychorismate lyase
MKQSTLNTVVLYDAATGQWLRFSSPIQVISAVNTREVLPALQLVEHMVDSKKLFAAGFLSYEAAPAFDTALVVKKTNGQFPLLWFGLYKKPSPFLLEKLRKDPVSYKTESWHSSVGFEKYKKTIRRIKNYISRGETYQVNYTHRLRTAFFGNELPFFVDLVSGAQTDYCAFLDIGRFAICSASPELFFHLNGDSLISKPMKGTVGRGRFEAEDIRQRQWLAASEKNRAENIMIVDMIRNDMGRIAETSSIRVKSLFDCERYPTLWQMTSTVTSKTKASIAQIITALFPCASITGAPKVSTMSIISKLESAPRRIYTGCIGYISPHRKALFNVAIRTVLIDKKNHIAEYGVGGGVIWQSKAAEEYKESMIKATALLRPDPEFSLLESFLWTPKKGYFLIGKHLNRLSVSATYFGFHAKMPSVRKKLDLFAQSLSLRPHKVRLLVARDGKITFEAIDLLKKAQSSPVLLKLALQPVDSLNRFLFHKTTNRRIYEQALADHTGCDDVLLFNERGEITETCTANIVVMKRGTLITPKKECGLLAGTFREHLLSQGKIQEKIIYLKDLKSAVNLYIINSVRKWRPAQIVR